MKREIEVKSTTSDNYKQKLMPVPIRLGNYMSSLLPRPGEDPKILLYKSEVGRMLGIYERHGAWMQPERYHSGTIIWSIQFPQGSKFFSGPEAPSALIAQELNYVKNRKFQGISMLDNGDGDGVMNMGKASKQMVDNQREQKRRAKAKEEEQGLQDAFIHETPLQPEE